MTSSEIAVRVRCRARRGRRLDKKRARGLIQRVEDRYLEPAREKHVPHLDTFVDFVEGLRADYLSKTDT